MSDADKKKYREELYFDTQELNRTQLSLSELVERAELQKDDLALVWMRTDRDHESIDYLVGIVRAEGSRYEEYEWWHKCVLFGKDEAHCAGGFAFQEMAREQQAIADALAAVVCPVEPVDG